MPAAVDEIGPNLFRIACYNEAANFQFSSFLVRDDEPLLYHTNLRGFFGDVKEAVGSILDPARIRWVGFSHFESDECGALNDWLAAAPNAVPVCSFVGARTSVGDFADRPPKVLDEGEMLETGAHRFRVLETKHLPHGWDCSLLFEMTGKTLFCSDLFGHGGNVEALTDGDIVGRSDTYNARQQEGPMAGSVPYTHETKTILEGLAALAPTTLACMHGSSFNGDGAQALRELGDVLEKSFGP
ncbi:MAG: MBL fold metallo-hydrolase [Alphaproteobacteria bacterium]